MSTHPQLAIKIERVQQLDDVLVVAGGQDIDFHHVVLQLFLRLCVDHFGGGEDARLFVLSLRGVKKTSLGSRIQLMLDLGGKS